MRLALALVLAAGCLPPPQDPPPPDPGSGWTGPQGNPISGCTRDSDCGSQTCARDGACYPASSIRSAHTTWTVHGAAASATSCAGHPQLEIAFSGSTGEWFGFAPVPCANGAFTVDKIASSYTQVALGTDGSSMMVSAAIRAGEATIDLP